VTEDFDAALLVVLLAFVAPIIIIGCVFYKAAKGASKHPEYIASAAKLAPLLL